MSNQKTFESSNGEGDSGVQRITKLNVLLCLAVLAGCGSETVETLGDLFEKLQAHKPGDKVKITVKRTGKSIVLDVTLKAGQ